MSKDPICSEVFNELALHPVLYPEEGRVGFCLLLENEMAGELSVLTGAWQLPHSCSGAGGEKRVLVNTPQRKTYLCLHAWCCWWDGETTQCLPSASRPPRSPSVALCSLEALLAPVTRGAARA